MGEGTPYGAAPPSWPVPPRGTTAIAPEPAQLPVALERARVALRLTDRVDGPGPCLVAYDDLGALATLAERLTPQEAGVTTDVLRLEQVLVTHPWVIDTLQAVLDQASLRQAATGLHIHHSTLQAVDPARLRGHEARRTSTRRRRRPPLADRPQRGRTRRGDG
ncbi:hypothetical protein OG819_49440 [Streptomyces sp. NBC_01549]|uniref:hypothetical protein n=1 Tax=unclassified Streptomyces TaxID=2593676 RepID=UPI00225B0788|nr:hypothetical protein [Streptomyces sp. NBC_01549]MCX4597333.1 hypothetical protein [Streptomyces sp. NBC_01549]